MLVKLAIATVEAALVGMELPSGTSTQHFDNIIVFGDSLSDVGNAYKATEGDSPPSPPYFQGRFSNGPVWVEYLASKLRLAANTDTNFAFGGATTGNSPGTPPGLLAQVKSFVTTHASADPNALYVIWAGANDYLGGATDTTTPVNNLVMAVKSLSAIGAKNIVVVNLPDLGKIPSTHNSERSTALTDLTNKHNSSLFASLAHLHHKLSSDISITYLDVNSLFNQVIKNPEKFGFTNVNKPCLSQVGICNNPNKYLFWDGVHPTTAAHKLFATKLTFAAQKSAPPPRISDPEITLALGLIGICALGAGLILKRKKSVKNSS